MKFYRERDGMVHFVIAAVEQMDLRLIQVNVQGSSTFPRSVFSGTGSQEILY